MHPKNQVVYNNLHSRLQKYIQDCCLFDKEPVDWYYIRSQCKSLKETNQVCADLIKYLNLTVQKNGEDFRPDCLGG